MNICKDCLVNITCNEPCEKFKDLIETFKYEDIVEIINNNNYKRIFNCNLKNEIIIKNGIYLMEINSYNITFKKHNKIHRDGDKPAFISSNGTKKWYKHTKKHRDVNKPAVMYIDGTKEWWKNGKIIRTNITTHEYK